MWLLRRVALELRQQPIHKLLPKLDTELVERIDAERTGNLSSALRLYVLRWLEKKAGEKET